MFPTLKAFIKTLLQMQKATTELGSGYVITKETLELIKDFEGFKSKAYKCPAGLWTIGYGNTFYKSGASVKEGDEITRSEADDLLKDIVDEFASKVNAVVKVDLNPCQFGALVSLTYNIGIGAFKKSTILKKVNKNPNDPAIGDEFMKWVKAGGITLQGLVKRRRTEAQYYFTKNCE